MKNQRLRNFFIATSAVVLLLLTAPVSTLRVGDVCTNGRLQSCGSCEGGIYLPINGGEKMLCAPEFKACSNMNDSNLDMQTGCNCCSDLNGYLSQEQCLPDHLCQELKTIGESCSQDAQCQSMACTSQKCSETPQIVRRMLQNATTTDNTTTTNTTTDTNTTNTNTTTGTTTDPPIVDPVIIDPVTDKNYSCFMCQQLGLAFDTIGCFNQTLNIQRFTTKSITTTKGCFANGYWIPSNNKLVTLPDTSNLGNETEVFTFTNVCNQTGEEFYLNIWNKLSQVNEINATLTTTNMSATGVDAYLDTYCQYGEDKNCSANDTRRGFTQYKSHPDEKIEFYLLCQGGIAENTTLTVTAKFLYNVETEEEEGLSGGGIAGIVIACIVVFLFIVGVLINKSAFAYISSLLKECKCCKKKISNLPDESPRAPNDVDRRETGLAGGNLDHHGHNPVSIQPSVDGKGGNRTSNAPLDELMGATSAPFPSSDLNSTGQHLLASLKNQSHEYNTNNDRNVGSAPGTGMPTSPSAQGGLPNIHQDKKGAAQQWNALDSERRHQDDDLNKLTDMKSSKRELTKDHSEGKE